MNKEFEWVKIANSENEISFNENNLAQIETPYRAICVGKFENKLFAFAAKCPHASAPLEKGYIDAAGNVVCPLHRYKFRMSNGRNVTGEGYQLKHWTVEVRVDGVYVCLQKDSLSSLL